MRDRYLNVYQVSALLHVSQDDIIDDHSFAQPRHNR